MNWHCLLFPSFEGVEMVSNAIYESIRYIIACETFVETNWGPFVTEENRGEGKCLHRIVRSVALKVGFLRHFMLIV